MNRHDKIHDPSSSTMYSRGAVIKGHMILKFYALQPGDEAIAFMWYGQSYLSPIPEPWGIVYTKEKS